MSPIALIRFLCCCKKNMKQPKPTYKKKRSKTTEKKQSKTTDVDNSNIHLFLRRAAIVSLYAFFLLYQRIMNQGPPNVS